MKPYIFLFFILIGLTARLSAQDSTGYTKLRKWTIGMDYGYAETKALGQWFNGINGEIRVFFRSRYSTGISTFIFRDKNFPNDFQYSISHPLLEINEVGWTNQYNFIRMPNFRTYINLTAGSAKGWLSERIVSNTRAISQIITIATNKYLLFEPGVDLAWRIPLEENSIVWLVAKARYRYLLERKNIFGEMKDFNGINLSAGISMRM